MATFELKVPPPVVALVVGGAMWLVAEATPRSTELLPAGRWVGGAFAAAGIGLMVLAGMQFWRARTTVNPMRPHRSSRLVVSGVYRFTRNPMYIGDLLLLVGWAFFLAAPVALVLPAVFVLYMNRFQIGPEERTLLSLWGPAYGDYLKKVRRWI